MSINDLFSTPEQGKRLKELVPELTSVYVWDYSGELLNYPYEKARFDSSSIFLPALTLQELRDVMDKINNDTIERIDEPFLSIDERVLFEDKVIGCNAPELAAWVIERLEGQS